MAVIARDIFSGDADSDITGRTPDGGLDPATGIGAWVKVAGTTCCIEIVPGVGAQGNSGDDSHYVLTGTGAVDDYTVRTTVDFGASPGGWTSVLGNYQSGSMDGYELELNWSGTFFRLRLYLWTAGSEALIDDPLGEFEMAAGPHTVELRRTGDQFFSIVDGVTKFVTVPQPVEIITGGSPGLCIAGLNDAAVTLFEVETDVLLPSPCVSTVPQAVYSQDCFSGSSPLTGGIEGRIPDGCDIDCVAQGVWHDVEVRQLSTPAQYVFIGHAVGDQTTTLVHVNSSGGSLWSHEAVEDIPGLGGDYSVEVEGRFTTLATFAWFSALARQQTGAVASAEVFTFNTTWLCPNDVESVLVKCWGGGGSGGGATGNPAAGGGGSAGAYAEKVVAVAPGTTYAVTVGNGTSATSGAGINGNPSSFGSALVVASGGRGGGLASVNSTNGAGGAPNTVGSVGDIITAGGAGTAGNFTPGAAGGNGGAAPNPPTGGVATGPTADSSAGSVGKSSGGGGGGGKANTTTDRSGGGGADGRVEISFTRAAGHTKESGWELLLTNEGNVELLWFENGVYHLVAFAEVVLTANATIKLKLCCSGQDFCCYVDDTLALVWHDDDNRFPSGTPGLCELDESGTSTVLRVSKWKVAGDEPGAPLCGNEEGGGGHQNPGTDVPALLWPVGKGAWRQVDVPIDAPTSRVRPYGRGVPRGAVPTGIYKQGAWRSLLPSSTGGGGGDVDQEGDPGDTYPDPGCGQIPSPEESDVDPVALTSRFYGITGTPVGNLNDILTGTQRPAGGWTRSDLIACAARGAILTTAQGGYDKFMPTGRWVLSNALPVYYRMLDPIYEDLLEFAEWHFGFSFLDDFSGATIWPPSGIPVADVREIGLALRDRYPGVNFGARIKPEEFGGFNPQLDFYSCQFVEWRNESAFSFGRRMYTDCKNWGALCRLDLNYIHGGSGESGVPFANNTGLGRSSHNFVCSAREIADYFTDMLAGALDADPSVDHLAGGLGYQWFPILFTIPNVWDGITTAHNAYAALPPLP